MTLFFFFFSSRRRHTRCSRDWSSDVCSSDLKEACRGIADACRALDTPVTGGNVSFYNESPGGAVDPTPVIGMIGLLTRAERAVASHARAAGDAVFVLGETRAELGGSQLWEALYGLTAGEPPRVDLAAERRLIE